MNASLSLDELRSPQARAALERALAGYLPQRRWFRSKARALEGVRLTHLVPLPAAEAELLLGVVRACFAEDPARGSGGEEGEDYALLFSAVDGPAADALARRRPQAIVAPLEGENPERRRVLVDALADERALRGLLSLLATADTVAAEGCSIAVRRLGGALDPRADPRPIDAEQSNTSVVCGDVILKLMRKLDAGRSPELEMGEFLTRAGYAHAPPLRASVEIARGEGEPSTLATLHAFVPNEGDAWRFALAMIARSWARASLPPKANGLGANGLAASGLSARAAQATAESGAAFVAPLAERVAALHAALASPAAAEDPRFAPEPIAREERTALGQAVLDSLARAWALFDARAQGSSPETLDLARRVRAREARVRACVERYVEDAEGARKTRVHGDLHLGQVLVSRGDFLIVDFEGEPARPLAERKAKRSPLVDVAGMLRSLHYASVAAWRAAPAEPRARGLAEAWHTAAHRGFVRSYLASARGEGEGGEYGTRGTRGTRGAGRGGTATAGDPRAASAQAALLRFHLLEKCVYELHYEMNNRPDWIPIPLFGLERILEDADAP